jgi:hypothetical protein
MTLVYMKIQVHIIIGRKSTPENNSEISYFTSYNGLSKTCPKIWQKPFLGRETTIDIEQFRRMMQLPVFVNYFIRCKNGDPLHIF